MDVSDDDVWTKPAQRAAQANAKKAIEKLFNDENEEVNCDYESPQTEVEELEDPEPSCFVNVEVKVEVNDEGSDVEEQESVDSSNTFLNISDPKSFTSEGTSKAKTIVAKLAQKLNSKLNAVVAPRPTDSLLECLEPEVSMATEDSITSGGLHACPWCTMSFMSLQFLEEHKKHYHQVSSRKSNQQSKSPELHTCEECGKTFAQSWCLKRHYIIHTGLRPFICVDCGEAFATGGELSFHQKSHVIQTLYKCIECEETFKSSNELRYHMIMHAPHICLICGERFFEEHLLHAHSQTHTIDRCWMCLHCDRGFSSQEILLTHQRNHTIEKQEQSEFVCDRCGKDFTKKENLEAHLKAHAEFRLCELCYLVFPNTAHMRMHMRGRHKVDPPKPYAELFRKGSYICLDCYKHFRFVNALKRHIRTSHSLAKTYKCDECGECFHDPTGLKGHLKVHTSWRPPYCHKCGERLKKDDWSVHMCSGQVLYECHVCGKSFFTNRSWKEHMKSHEGRNVVRTADSTTADGTYFPSRSDHVIFIPETAKDSNAFRASIADKLKGTGFFTEKRNEADNFKDKIAGRLMGTGFVAEKKNEVNNFRDTIAERLKETGMLSFGNGKVSLSLLKFEKE